MHAGHKRSGVSPKEYDMDNWIEVTKYGRNFIVRQEGDLFIRGGKKDLCIRDGVKNKTQVMKMIRLYKDQI